MKIKLIAPARKPEWGESFWDLKMGGGKISYCRKQRPQSSPKEFGLSWDDCYNCLHELGHDVEVLVS